MHKKTSMISHTGSCNYIHFKQVLNKQGSE